ncbi:hypothetical protein D3C87_1608880 [compost metagenome]
MAVLACADESHRDQLAAAALARTGRFAVLLLEFRLPVHQIAALLAEHRPRKAANHQRRRLRPGRLEDLVKARREAFELDDGELLLLPLIDARDQEGLLPHVHDGACAGHAGDGA